MTASAIMLALLVGPYLALTVLGRLLGREVLDRPTRGCLGLALVFLFTGVGHFIQTEPMAAMMPPWTPAVIVLIYMTGMVVLAPKTRQVVGWGLVAMLVCFLPVNIYAAVNRVGMGGHLWGPVYLLIRVPLQLLLIWWVWRFAIRRKVGSGASGPLWPLSGLNRPVFVARPEKSRSSEGSGALLSLQPSKSTPVLHTVKKRRQNLDGAGHAQQRPSLPASQERK